MISSFTLFALLSSLIIGTGLGIVVGKRHQRSISQAEYSQTMAQLDSKLETLGQENKQLKQSLADTKFHLSRSQKDLRSAEEQLNRLKQRP